jgi:hypothetical protein
MNHAEKIKLMFDDLPRRGVAAGTFAPPLYRMLWKFGVQIPPPHFSSFTFLFFFQGGFFGIFWGLLMGLLFWTPFRLPLWPFAFASISAGVLFGLCMATYYRWQARKHHLPCWHDYGRV